MTLKQTIKLLEYHNNWRRGYSIPMTNPKKLGIALDVAVAELKQIADYKAIIKALRGTTTVANESFMDDYYIVVKCCGVGPITNENYCPQCGRKILKP